MLVSPTRFYKQKCLYFYCIKSKCLMAKGRQLLLSSIFICGTVSVVAFVKNKKDKKNECLLPNTEVSFQRTNNEVIVENKKPVVNAVEERVHCNCEERCIAASEKAVQSVVHIYASQHKVVRSFNPMNDLLREFFGGRFQGGDFMEESKTIPISAYGSGVIVKSNGFIVTNNHVVEGAEKVEITLHDNRKFEAKIVGTDPANDLALLKIEALGLPFLEMGDSDALRIGESVISVGNPFSTKELYSTVTKGIISAKMRLLRDGQSSHSALPSLIQFDAAVNSGSSGGAIVNMDGKLVGINIAVASNTKSFVGYAYGIPVNIVKRVISDIEKYGYVQKIVLGISCADITDELVKEKKLKRYDGVLIGGIEKDSVVTKAGIKENDIIVKVNDLDTLCLARFLEILVQCDPLKPLKITVDRFGTIKEFTVQPKAPNVINISKDKDKLIMQGVVFKNLDEKMIKYLANANITGGVQITEVSDQPWKKVVKKGYIVLSINDQPVKNIEDVKNIISSKRGTFLFDGVYPGNVKSKECFALRLGEDIK